MVFPIANRLEENRKMDDAEGPREGVEARVALGAGIRAQAQVQVQVYAQVQVQGCVRRDDT